MTFRKSYLFLSICFCVNISAFPALAEPINQVNTSWLDRPIQNWNRVGTDFPKLPRPTGNTTEIAKQCLEQVRPPETPAERALTRQGWKLYGSVQNYGITKVITATSNFDGMCRPVQFQAFVYWEGRYAGTLSPVAMDSRSDGAIANIYLSSVTSLSVDFHRYRDSDPLCCPSRMSTVSFSLRPDDIPDLKVIGIEAKRPICPNTQSQAEVTANANLLLSKKWTLVEMDDRKIKARDTYIEFDQVGFSGSGGCNRIGGGYKVDGTKLEFSQIFSTKKACFTENIEATFLKLLGSTTSFEVKSDKLRLYNGDRLILVFRS
jgi:heat shock protein HslJ